MNSTLPPQVKATNPAIGRAHIARTYELIRPYVRRTPAVELDGVRIILKLELLQH